jgi:hypothetical protein
MTIHVSPDNFAARTEPESGWRSRATISWRKNLILNRDALSEAWDVAFPRHDFGTGRLRQSSLYTFGQACAKAEAEAAKRPVDATTMRVRRLLANDVSLEAAYRAINDPRNRPTPQTTVEAILHCVRERGPSALKEPANVERLRRCDNAARRQVNERIAARRGAA